MRNKITTPNGNTYFDKVEQKITTNGIKITLTWTQLAYSVKSHDQKRNTTLDQMKQKQTKWKLTAHGTNNEYEDNKNLV